jgi:hypothetical protein
MTPATFSNISQTQIANSDDGRGVQRQCGNHGAGLEIQIPFFPFLLGFRSEHQFWSRSLALEPPTAPAQPRRKFAAEPSHHLICGLAV